MTHHLIPSTPHFSPHSLSSSSFTHPLSSLISPLPASNPIFSPFQPLLSSLTSLHLITSCSPLYVLLSLSLPPITSCALQCSDLIPCYPVVYPCPPLPSPAILAILLPSPKAENPRCLRTNNFARSRTSEPSSKKRNFPQN